MTTGSWRNIEDAMLFLTRIKNIFCRPNPEELLVLPVLLLLTSGVVMIFFWIVSFSLLEQNEYIFLFALWLWLILLSIILIKRIYVSEKY
jgi:high-affinity K+ transport system ATPase subunit B